LPSPFSAYFRWRGRVSSGDGPAYRLAMEYADVAAVVAFGAATLTSNIRKLMLCEGWPVPDIARFAVPPDVTGRLESLLTQGHPGQMLETFYRDIAMMSGQEISGLKASPAWPARVAAARTVPRELRALGGQALDPGCAAKITVSVLLLVGADSSEQIKADPDAVAAALPDARITIVQDQAHIAHLTGPESFAKAVISFLRD
jgi:pimeloyl-ACP methyl ester carboxylesterase